MSDWQCSASADGASACHLSTAPDTRNDMIYSSPPGQTFPFRWSYMLDISFTSSSSFAGLLVREACIMACWAVTTSAL